MLEMLNIVFQTSDVDVILSQVGMTGNEIALIHPDLVFLDVQIKGYITTGDEICKEIKSLPELSHVPVFLISGEEDLDLISIECEADGFFTKPFDVLKLRSLIRDKLL